MSKMTEMMEKMMAGMVKPEDMAAMMNAKSSRSLAWLTRLAR